MRLSYKKSQIDFKNLDENPIDFFLKWFEHALKLQKKEVNACILSTVNTDNKPSSRVVLLKSIDKEGFTFFTNYNSHKSLDIDKNPHVALNFYWPELERQVRVSGVANKISSKDSDEYFKCRPRESQVGSWLSHQSAVIPMCHDFTQPLDDIDNRFKGNDVERPLYWGGYSIMPNRMEFWQGRPSRLHDRLLYELKKGVWKKKRLAP